MSTDTRHYSPLMKNVPFSDLFNLPLPALWSVVLGENNRKVESGYEQRIPVDKIIMHEKYRHFKNDLGRCTVDDGLLHLAFGWPLKPNNFLSVCFSSHEAQPGR